MYLFSWDAASTREVTCPVTGACKGNAPPSSQNKCPTTNCVMPNAKSQKATLKKQVDNFSKDSSFNFTRIYYICG